MLRAQAKSPHVLAGIAADVGCGVSALDGFLNNRGDIPAHVKQRLALRLSRDNLVFNIAADALEPAHKVAPTTFATAIPLSVKLLWLDSSKLPYRTAARR